MFAFPALISLLAPVFRPFLSTPAALNAVHMGLAFVLLLVPATAMGATLPIVAQALSPRQPDFGRVLGRLYGFNTIGAVAGAIAGEVLLIERLGIRGTGVVAASLDLAVAAAALALASAFQAPGRDSASDAGLRRSGPAWRFLGAAFICGGILLALEVVWFRFLLLFLEATSLIFAVLLAVVLAGIALGGLAAAAWLRRDPDAHHRVAGVALLAGVTAALSYAAFTGALLSFHRSLMTGFWEVAWFGTRLMLPTCFLSGVLFPLLGKSLREHVPSEARVAGWLTLANTLGGASGALLGGFVLLPRLGVEQSLFLLAATYGVVPALAGLGLRGPAWSRKGRIRTLWATVAAFAAALVLFPHGLMRNHYVPQATRRWMGDQSRDGRDARGPDRDGRLPAPGLPGRAPVLPPGHQLHLHGLHIRGQPALHGPVRLVAARAAPAAGDGAAHQLWRGRDRERARAIGHPASDRRRGHLLRRPGAEPAGHPGRASARRSPRARARRGRALLPHHHEADLPTSSPPEPPPPKEVVSLYTREYFELSAARRLRPGGLATYWLPVAILEPSDFKAIVRAFCDAFSDCSLWTGYGPEWMLAGTGGSFARPSDEGVGRLWSHPRSGRALRRAGLEVNEQLGTLFIADARQPWRS